MRNSCQNRREGSGARRTDPEEAIAKIQAATEEMTMHRYVRPDRSGTGPGGPVVPAAGTQSNTGLPK